MSPSKRCISVCTCPHVRLLSHPPETQTHCTVMECESWWKLTLISHHSSFNFESLENGSSPTLSNKVPRKSLLCLRSSWDGKWHLFAPYLPSKGDSPKIGKGLISRWFASWFLSLRYFVEVSMKLTKKLLSEDLALATLEQHVCLYLQSILS